MPKGKITKVKKSFSIDTEVFKELEERAWELRLRYSQAVEKALREWLKKLEARNEKN